MLFSVKGTKRRGRVVLLWRKYGRSARAPELDLSCISSFSERKPWECAERRGVRLQDCTCKAWDSEWGPERTWGHEGGTSSGDERVAAEPNERLSKRRGDGNPVKPSGRGIRRVIQFRATRHAGRDSDPRRGMRHAQVELLSETKPAGPANNNNEEWQQGRRAANRRRPNHRRWTADARPTPPPPPDARPTTTTRHAPPRPRRGGSTRARRRRAPARPN